MTNVQPKVNQRRRGAAMVEMALVLPLFLMLVLGIIEFGRAMMIANLVTNAAREGARTAVLDGSTNASVTSDIQTFLRSAIGNAISNPDIIISITVVPAAGNPDPANVL
ncbi:MAG: pilus assembly protein, partial [Planctomycetes bacterium]|nr:pilus assembly protein [Planctomycetota bacterium]